jgi:DNA-directed RNA polymerase subunit RPC12/RpoP
MVRFKGCPRCHGDVTIEEFHGETELVCLQCGHRTFAVHRPGRRRRSLTGRSGAPRPPRRLALR